VIVAVAAARHARLHTHKRASFEGLDGRRNHRVLSTEDTEAGRYQSIEGPHADASHYDAVENFALEHREGRARAMFMVLIPIHDGTAIVVVGINDQERRRRTEMPPHQNLWVEKWGSGRAPSW
jgi:hypothetical protein